MMWSFGPPGWQVALAVGAAIVAGLWGWGTMRYNAGWHDGRAALVADQRAVAEQIRGRVRDADVGQGDADDDLCWLARRMRLEPPAGCE